MEGHQDMGLDCMIYKESWEDSLLEPYEIERGSYCRLQLYNEEDKAGLFPK